MSRITLIQSDHWPLCTSLREIPKACRPLQSVTDRNQSAGTGRGLLGGGHMGQGADLDMWPSVGGLCHTLSQAKTEHVASGFLNMLMFHFQLRNDLVTLCFYGFSIFLCLGLF